MNNQFGPGVVDVVKPEEICVPSSKKPTLHEVYDSPVDNSSAIHPALAVAMDIPYPALTGGWMQVRDIENDDSIRQDVVAGPCKISFQ